MGLPREVVVKQIDAVAEVVMRGERVELDRGRARPRRRRLETPGTNAASGSGRDE
jgi:hypothetical protein